MDRAGAPAAGIKAAPWGPGEATSPGGGEICQGGWDGAAGRAALDPQQQGPRLCVSPRGELTGWWHRGAAEGADGLPSRLLTQTRLFWRRRVSGQRKTGLWHCGR